MTDGADDGDAEVSAAMLKIQIALQGVDIEAALNALAYQTGILAVIGAETKGDALSCCLTAQKTAREVVNDFWGRPDIEAQRQAVRRKPN